MSQDPPQPVDRSLDRIDDTLCRIDESLSSIAESLKAIGKFVEASGMPLLSVGQTPPRTSPPSQSCANPECNHRRVIHSVTNNSSRCLFNACPCEVFVSAVVTTPIDPASPNSPRRRGVYRPTSRALTEESIKDLALEHADGHHPNHPVAVFSYPRSMNKPLWKAYCLTPECPAFIATDEIRPEAQRIEWYQQGTWRTFYSQPTAEDLQQACVTCKGTGRGLNKGGGRGICRVCKGFGTKQVAPYPLDTHDPESWCRHPDCPDTNWHGQDRLHARWEQCPPDDGSVAKGDQWDREHYLPSIGEQQTEKEPTDG